jgi:hypothetical protein
MNNSVFTTRDIVKYLIISGIVYIILKVIFNKSTNINQPIIRTDSSKLTENFVVKSKQARNADTLSTLATPVVTWFNKKKTKK